MGYIVDQILLGTEFYNLQKETAVAMEIAQCCGGPEGRMFVYEKVKSSRFSHIAQFLRWVCDPSLYDPLSDARGDKGRSGGYGYDNYGYSLGPQGDNSYQGAQYQHRMNDVYNRGGGGMARGGQGGGHGGHYDQQRYDGDPREQGYYVNYGRGGPSMILVVEAGVGR